MKKSELKRIIREEIKKVIREVSLKFDKRKVETLIKQDKFLTHLYKTKGKGGPIEDFFATYIVGDSEFEKEYQKL